MSDSHAYWYLRDGFPCVARVTIADNGSTDGDLDGAGSSATASWVVAHFTAKTAGGATVYDLTQQK